MIELSLSSRGPGLNRSVEFRWHACHPIAYFVIVLDGLEEIGKSWNTSSKISGGALSRIKVSLQVSSFRFQVHVDGAKYRYWPWLSFVRRRSPGTEYIPTRIRGCPHLKLIS